MTNWVGGVSYTVQGTGLSAELHTGQTPAPAPKALFLTRAVETMDGWIGQLLVDGDIVYQTNFKDDGKKAVNDANTFLVERIKSLFVETIDLTEEVPGDGPTWSLKEDPEPPKESTE